MAGAEVLSDGEQYSTSADVYSFGMVMWEIAAGGEDPFTEFKNEKWSAFEFQKRIAKEDVPLRPTLKPEWQEQYCNLVRQCWASKPSARPSFSDIVRTLVGTLGLQDSSEPALLRKPSLYGSVKTVRAAFASPPAECGGRPPRWCPGRRPRRPRLTRAPLESSASHLRREDSDSSSSNFISRGLSPLRPPPESEARPLRRESPAGPGNSIDRRG